MRVRTMRASPPGHPACSQCPEMHPPDPGQAIGAPGLSRHARGLPEAVQYPEGYSSASSFLSACVRVAALYHATQSDYAWRACASAMAAWIAARACGLFFQQVEPTITEACVTISRALAVLSCASDPNPICSNRATTVIPTPFNARIVWRYSGMNSIGFLYKYTT